MAALSLKGQVGIVTGAGSPSGIGRSLVVALAKAGAKAVYACDLNMGNIPSLQKKIADMSLSCQVEGRLLDVSSEEETLSLIKDILRMHGRFDFYFANAGFASVKSLNDLDSASFDRAINVMVRSVYLGMRFSSQAMQHTCVEKPKPGGTFVVTSSNSSFSGSFGNLAYTTAKAAVNGMVASGSVQLSASNVRVNGIAPGAVRTSILASTEQLSSGLKFDLVGEEKSAGADFASLWEMSGSADKYYYDKLIDPEQIANVGVFLASNLASAINGTVVVVDNGQLAAAHREKLLGPIAPVQALQL
ncbi:hypothetical protein QC760_010239 [Botrytis cinerea]